jgi:thiamine-monophosphate kinase
LTRLNEFALINKLTAQKQSETFLRDQGVTVGIGDDAAVAQVSPGSNLVMTCDTMVEGVHFNRWTMQDADIGFKAMASNISDIAAMGAKPKFALVSVSLPKKYSELRLKRIYKGLYECANLYKTAIIGGDTTSSLRDFTLFITVIGEIEPNKALLRSAAKPGDKLFITGILGRSAAGLHYLMKQKQSNLNIDHMPKGMRDIVMAHRRPKPSIEAGLILQRSSVCHALNDVSDGLASEAWEIAEASQVGILLDEARVPIGSDLKAYAEQAGMNPLDWMLYGGEDYVLVGTLPSQQVARMQRDFQSAGIDLYIIGDVTREFKSRVQMVDREGNLRPIEKKGYHHF